ncbi:ADP-ribosyl cyclase/cyclic ADP-ribose hydrolase 1-like [Diretmus argenteus]
MRTLYVVVIVGTVLVLIIAISVALGLTLSPNIKSTFMNRCEKLKSNEKCQNIWRAFEKAYVGKDPCNVPMEAYNELISTAPFEYAHNRVMFWSKIKKSLVRDFTEKRRCFVTLEDTLLGSVLDGLKWCGKEGSSESGCENNPVRSFWKRASAAFADVASGHVTAMLDGSIPMPFDPTSIFGSIEVDKL